MSSCPRLAAALSAVLALSLDAAAQCGTWEPHFNALGLDGTATAAVSFDDGSGPVLCVGGSFARAGGVAATRVARWDGSAWSALGAGLPAAVLALAVHDFGGGPELVAASGTRVYRFDGASWQQLGGAFSNTVNALCSFDDGSGAKLYAGGAFSNNGPVTLRTVACWNAGAWTALGTGLFGLEAAVHDLCVHDDGSGSALYVAGRFAGTPTVTSHDLIRWDGTSWSAVGSGVDLDADDYVRALAVHDDGAGARLILAGIFDSAGGAAAENVASWDGASYAAYGTGLSWRALDLCVLDAPGGAMLVAAGDLTDEPGAQMRGTARYSAGTWVGMGSGPGLITHALAVHDDGRGARMHAVGSFVNAHGSRVTHWDGVDWRPLPDGLGVLGAADALVAFDDGNGPALFVGGSFGSAGLVPAQGLARWSGSDWSALSGALDGAVRALAVWNDGNGSALYAGGTFQNAGGQPAVRIARWDGASWSALGAGLGSASFNPIENVEALAAFDDGTGSALYAGGMFSTAGSTSAIGVARWDGSAWTDLDLGLDGPAYELLAFDDGRGPGLYVAGDFSAAGSVGANRVARWDGSAWHALGSGAADGVVRALCVFDDGGGAQLYAGGTFSTIGGIAAQGFARWDGAAWNAVAHPFANAYELLVADLGSGPDFVAASSTGVFARDAGTWSTLGALNGPGTALALFDSEQDGTPDLYVGGSFSAIDGGVPYALGIASWRGCATSATAYCAGDASASACPCGNVGSAGHGCDNSLASGGAHLTVSGAPSVSNDSLRLACDGLPPNTTTLFVQATAQSNGGMGVVLGDGLLCIAGAVLRVGSPIAQGDAASVGFGAQLAEQLSIKGQIPQAGATRHYQVRYRNVASFCTPATFNQSNGSTVVWMP